MIAKILACVVLMLPYGLVKASAPKQENPSPIEGAWELVSAKWPNGRFPEDFSGSLIKIYSQHDFAFVGRTSRGSEVQERYGAGRFELTGSDYAESIAYHCVPGLVGRTIHFNLEIKDGEMKLSGPVVSPGEKDPGFRLEEVYRRKQ